eukprot:CAMPEP_0202860662 /NCGR_PEP_ID=MMETSP1391-20130828/2300_1 /ASSEMBLY_ACC=CAM_ASM_000867 /TAXON_ID=1034604 /ORGANISM="Chlamydomonas leiostraca, Strain SAG 11-49" /LENGTH=162 /DNA_ID=CAMNT_0049539879 /DNA_START=99 /DNA_END=584 /DNA_ORIENTATION=-
MQDEPERVSKARLMTSAAKWQKALDSLKQGGLDTQPAAPAPLTKPPSLGRNATMRSVLEKEGPAALEWAAHNHTSTRSKAMNSWIKVLDTLEHDPAAREAARVAKVEGADAGHAAARARWGGGAKAALAHARADAAAPAAAPGPAPAASGAAPAGPEPEAQR